MTRRIYNLGVKYDRLSTVQRIYLGAMVSVTLAVVTIEIVRAVS